MNWETYLALGDSITKGARTYLGYPELTAHKLSQKLNKEWDIINVSSNGITAIELLKLFEDKCRHSHVGNSSFTTILVGTNDVKNGSTVEEFTIAYDLLLTKVKIATQSSNIYLIHIPTFPKGVMFPYTSDMNTTVLKFNEVINALATKHQLKTLELKLTENDFYDGVHLNSEGIQSVAHQICETVLISKGY